MSKTKKTFIVLALLFIFLGLFSFFPQTVWGQTANVGDSAKPTWTGLVPCGRNSGTPAEMAPCTLCHLVVGFQRLTQYALYMVVTLALVGIFFAGVMYIVSSGDEGMMSKAKTFLKVSLIGFSVVIVGWLIVNVTLWVLGAKQTGDPGSANNPGSGVLGIEIQDWHTFTCSTQSSAGTGGTNSSAATTNTASPNNAANNTGSTNLNNSNNSANTTNPGSGTLPITATPGTDSGGGSDTGGGTDGGGSTGGGAGGGDVDLTLTAFSGITSSFNSGVKRDISFTVKNQGADAAGAFSVKLSASGSVIGSVSISGLAAGQSVSQGMSVSLPGCGLHSDCQFTLKVDADNQIKETDESNNTRNRTSLQTR